MPLHRTRIPLVVLLGATAALVVRRSLVAVRGPSMEPTLWPGDRLVTVPAVAGWLRVGQVVVLDDPEDASHRIIKRIVAVAGDHVEVRGDDPQRSTDGRRWGPVPRDAVRRIAITRWPSVLSPLHRRPTVIGHGAPPTPGALPTRDAAPARETAPTRRAAPTRGAPPPRAGSAARTRGAPPPRAGSADPD